MNNLINILSNSNKDIDNQKLMDYLSGKLSGKDKNEVEQWMSDNPFAEEALEGLSTIKKQRDIDLYVEQLNKQLNVYIEQKKRRRDKKKISNLQAPMVAIAIVLILIVVVLLVISLSKN